MESPRPSDQILGGYYQLIFFDWTFEFLIWLCHVTLPYAKILLVVIQNFLPNGFKEHYFAWQVVIQVYY